MTEQTRLETLRDLIISKTSGVVIGKAIGSDELKRSIGDLCAERDALKNELHSHANAKAEKDRETMLAAMDAQKRQAVKALVSRSREELTKERDEVKAKLAALRISYSHLSAALQYLDAGDRVKSMYEALSPEEREAFDALK